MHFFSSICIAFPAPSYAARLGIGSTVNKKSCNGSSKFRSLSSLFNEEKEPGGKWHKTACGGGGIEKGGRVP